MAKIIIPTPLRKFTAGKATIETTGTTVQDAVNDLVTKNPSLKVNLLDKSGNIRSFIRIFVGEEDIYELNGAATTVENNTIISIVPAIAGGSY